MIDLLSPVTSIPQPLPPLLGGHIWVGNPINVATPVIPSQDVAMTNAGAFTVIGLQTVPVSNAAPADGNILTYVAVDGKWRPKPASTGSVVPISSGGTGQTTAAAAFNALSPMTTAGDMIYGGAAGAGTRLPAGTATQLLIGGPSAPSWGAVALASMVSGILPIANGGTGSATQVWVDLVNSQSVSGIKTWLNQAIFTPPVTSGTGANAGVYILASAQTTGDAVHISGAGTSGNQGYLLSLDQSSFGINIGTVPNHNSFTQGATITCPDVTNGSYGLSVNIGSSQSANRIYSCGIFTAKQTGSALVQVVVCNLSSGAQASDRIWTAQLAGVDQVFVNGQGYLNAGAANNIVGVATNNNAAAGNLGEDIDANSGAGTVTFSGSAATPQAIVSITLSAGDWDVSAALQITALAAISQAQAGLNSVNNALPAAAYLVANYGAQAATGAVFSMIVPTQRISLAASTTYYLVGTATYIGTNPVMSNGYIHARRCR